MAKKRRQRIVASYFATQERTWSNSFPMFEEGGASRQAQEHTLLKLISHVRGRGCVKTSATERDAEIRFLEIGRKLKERTPIWGCDGIRETSSQGVRNLPIGLVPLANTSS